MKTLVERSAAPPLLLASFTKAEVIEMKAKNKLLIGEVDRLQKENNHLHKMNRELRNQIKDEKTK